jgi:hypothetical protein
MLVDHQNGAGFDIRLALQDNRCDAPTGFKIQFVPEPEQDGAWTICSSFEKNLREIQILRQERPAFGSRPIKNLVIRGVSLSQL